MINKLRYWTHKILPLTYDDSLSYYEVLAKLTKKVNEIIEKTGVTITIAQELGDDPEKVVSQKALTEAIEAATGATITQTTGQSTTAIMSQKAVTDELNGKLDKDALVQNTGYNAGKIMSQKAITEILDGIEGIQVVQETGNSETKVMSQKAVTDAIESAETLNKMDKYDPVGSGTMSMNGSATGQRSAAFGNNAVASGNVSFAFGDYSEATGDFSFAEGLSSNANGVNSVAMGGNANALKQGSIALGQYVVADSAEQVVVGRFNNIDSANRDAFIVGGGGTNADRKNLMTLHRSGDVRFKGDVYVGANEDGTGGTKVSTTEISGEDDGANWTNITIGDKTRAIPSGGSRDNAKLLYDNDDGSNTETGSLTYDATKYNTLLIEFKFMSGSSKRGYSYMVLRPVDTQTSQLRFITPSLRTLNLSNDGTLFLTATYTCSSGSVNISAVSDVVYAITSGELKHTMTTSTNAHISRVWAVANLPLSVA